MKILCIVDRFYPNNNPNGVCCENLANEFIAQGHSVDFLALRDNVDCPYEIYKQSHIIKIDSMCDEFIRKHKYKIRLTYALPERAKLMAYIQSRLRYFYRKTTRNSELDFVNYNKVYKSVCKVSDHYDLILSFCYPFGIHVLANQLMKRNLADKWFAVSFDAFEYYFAFPNREIKYRKKLAQKVLKRADKIFLADGLLQEFEKKNYQPSYLHKVKEIYIPMLREVQIENKETIDNDEITLTYTGRLYPDIRNPEKMLQILSYLPATMKINLFSLGCQDIVHKYATQFMEGQLTNYGFVSHHQVLEEISKSNVLINLGNTITNQMPSKLFEYISLGKPILNFYFSEEDMCLKVFKKYPLAFNVNLNNYSQSDIDAMIAFLETHKNICIPYEDATKNLTEYKASYVANIITQSFVDES